MTTLFFQGCEHWQERPPPGHLKQDQGSQRQDSKLPEQEIRGQVHRSRGKGGWRLRDLLQQQVMDSSVCFCDVIGNLIILQVLHV